jgi:hypothetical protein
MANSERVVAWYAAGGGTANSGPFESQAKAWHAMLYCDEEREKTGLDHPADTRVCPVETS